MAKMTLVEFLAWDGRGSIEEYAKSLKEIKKKQSALRCLLEEQQDLEDALDILSDEAGSARWFKKSERLNHVNHRIEELKAELNLQ